VAALATYYQRTQFTSDDYQLTVSVNDKEIETIKVRGDAPNREIDIPADVLKDGRNKVEMTINGRGQYTYLATLNGFSSQLTSWVGVEPNPNEKWENTRVRRRYYHAPLEYDGRPISAKSTSKITQLIAGTRTYVSVNVTPGRYGILRRKGNVRGYLVVDEYLPAGTTLVSGTIHGDFQHHEIGDSFIRFYYAPRYQIHNYGYQLISYAPGEYRVLPTVIRDAMHPGDMRIGTVASLTVLAPGEKSTDEYKMNNGERYALGKAYFDDGKYNEALPLLEELHKLKPDYREKDTAQMLLWMYTIPDNYDARKVVATFELLRERYLELYIPFDKIRVVGTAYRDIEEFERATLVHQSTIASSFANDSNVSAVLQDEGQFLHSIDFMENLWQQYPDTASVISSYFALSQALYANKDKGLKDARFRDTKNTSKSVTKWDMLKRTVELLSQFLTLYPTHPLADDAAFSLTNATLDLEDFQAVVRLCQLNQERYPNSDFITNFQYVEALGLFSLQAYDKAIQAATLVATSESDDRDFARYILGQIYHAQGTPHQAIEWYDKVKESYPDAKESIAYFEDKRIALPEVTIKRPEEEASFTLKYRNIKEVAIQVYRVDLMKLYLREKDLSRVTQVRLAGIEPKVSKNLTLGDGKDYIEKSREIPFSLTEEGAYLVICRGDNLFTSGLILITPLEIEVQEDAVSGRVRVNVRNVVTGSYQPKVHVKAIASADSRFIPGETDLRGVFIADGMHGKVTIIARDNVNRYAFYRGSQWLGEPETEAKKQKKDKQLMPAPTQVPNYRMYLDKRNEAIQSSNIDALDRMRRGVRKGVQVQSVY
jgi:tetratricopeptide (TPR) repeat protein